MSARKQPRPEREQTDASLRTERKKSDIAIAERFADSEEDADKLLERARERADSVLNDARELADRKTEDAEPRTLAQTRKAIAKERAQEDGIIQNEREEADEILRRERQEQARVLARLLPLERDKTDRYLLTERARSDEAVINRDDFLGMVSHDLRNLLSGIILSAGLRTELDTRTPVPGDRSIEKMERIQRYAARMNRLIGDLVDVVSIEAGRLALQPAPADVTALFDEVIDVFTPAASVKGVSLVAEVGEPHLRATFDHERLLQVLANLITNALKFTPPGGTISLRGERSAGALHLSVRDTGSGIPSDLLEAVFERFWQVGANDRRGLGLGLYISRCIVEAHGGRIWAESTPGEGSVFHLTIPDAESP